MQPRIHVTKFPEPGFKMKSQEVSRLKYAIYDYAISRCGELFIITGGKRGGSYRNKQTCLAHVYNAYENTWREEPSLQHARSSHSSCFMGTRVYVFEGLDSEKQHRVSSIEMLDLAQERIIN